MGSRCRFNPRPDPKTGAKNWFRLPKIATWFQSAPRARARGDCGLAFRLACAFLGGDRGGGEEDGRENAVTLNNLTAVYPLDQSDSKRCLSPLRFYRDDWI